MIDREAPPTGARDGIVERFERLYREEVDRVYGYARARLGPDEAEEVVSEVFHVAALAVRDEEWNVLTPAWLMTVTRNKVIDRWRRAQRRRVRDQLLKVRDRDRLIELDRWTDPGHREEVVATLDRMSSRNRMLLVLHYLDGMSAPDIATELDMSTSAVESALARARREFRKLYSEGSGT